MKKLTLKEAVQKWVGEFNAIPQPLIVKAYYADGFSEEVTELTVGETVYICDNCSTEYSQEDKGVHIEENENGDHVCLDCYKGEAAEHLEEHGEALNINESIMTCEESTAGNDYYGELPMWGTMWTFGDSSDEHWALNNLKEMSELGFKVFETDELGVFFGIDGAGYDFYEAHWIPLYQARGLKWHSDEKQEA